MPEVLVVDDSREFRELVSMLLENDGFRVRLAGDGSEALRAIEAGAPDAIILDLRMPEHDGFELLAEIRRRGLAPDAFVVVLTASEQPGDQQRSQDLGAVSFHTKPFDCDRFIGEFARYVAARRLHASA
jgi:CheY-like chemotaxis protein